MLNNNEQDIWTAPIQSGAEQPLDTSTDTEQDYWSQGVETPEYFDVNLGEGVSGQASFHDADTLAVLKPDGTTDYVRFNTADAGERTKIKDGYLQSGSNVGNKQIKVLRDLARQGGFNNITYTGEKTADGRPIGALTNAAGLNLEDEAIVGGVLNASDYAGDAHQQKVRKLMQRKGVNAARESLVGGFEALTPMEQAREIIEYERGFTGFGVKTKATNTSEAFFGTHASREALGKELDKKRKVLMDNNLKGKELEKAQAEFDAIEAQLVANLNINEPYFGSGTEARRNGGQRSRDEVGFFGETYGAVGRGYQNLHVMAGNTAKYFGDVLNSEGLGNWGEEWAGLAEEELRNYPERIGLFDITGPISAFKATGEAIIEFGPQLALLYGAQALGGIAGGAVGTLAGPAGTVAGATAGRAGAAWAASYLMQVGGIYDSMPEGEKDTLVASGLGASAAVVEALGLGGKALQGANILTKEGKELFIDATVAAGKAEGREQATELLNRNVSQLIADSSDILSDLATKGMVRQQGFKDVIGAGIRAGREEAIAEGLQQIISDGGVAAFTSLELDPVDFLKNVLDSAATGGVVGGAYGAYRSGDKSGGDYATVNDLIYQNREVSVEEASTLADYKSKASEFITNKYGEGRIPTRNEIANKFRAAGEGLNIMSVSGVDGTTIGAGFKALFADPVSGLRRLGDTFNKRAVNPDGSINETGALLTGLSSRGILTGADIKQTQAVNANTVQKRVDDTLVKNNLRTEAAANKALRNNSQATAGIIQSLAPVFQETANMLDTGNNTSIGVNGITANDLKDPANFIRERLVKVNNQSDIDKIANFFDGREFQTESGRPFNMNGSGARALADRIAKRRITADDRQVIKSTDFYNQLTPDQMNDHAFSEVVADLRQISNLAPVYKTYGENGEVLLKILNEGRYKRNDIDETTYNEFVGKAQALFSANTNQYQNWDSQAISKIQSAAMTYSFLRVFDSGLFAQAAELMYSKMYIEKGFWTKYLGRTTGEFVKDLGFGAKDTASTITGHRVEKLKPQTLDDTFGTEIATNRDMAEALGLIGSGQNLAAQSGAASGTRANQFASNAILAFGGVRSFTNANRVGVASNAIDLNKPHLDAVAKFVATGVPTKASIEGARIIREYGADPLLIVGLSNKLPANVANPSMQDLMNGIITIDTPDGKAKVSLTEFLTPNDLTLLTENMAQIVVGTSDKLAARPGANDVPLAYSGERFAGPLQYTKFIAYTTANTIPAMWKDVTSRTGNVGMSYQAFQMVALAMATAYLSQAIKDSLQYGETPDWIEDEDDDFWNSETFRAADYTGFGGTPGIFMGHLNELLRAPQGEDNPGAALLGAILQIPPPVGIISQDIKRLNRDPAEGVTRIVPFFGDNYQSKQWIYQQLAPVLNEEGKIKENI